MLASHWIVCNSPNSFAISSDPFESISGPFGSIACSERGAAHLLVLLDEHGPYDANRKTRRFQIPLVCSRLELLAILLTQAPFTVK